MTARQVLHQIVDDLPDRELEIATRILAALRATADPVLLSLLSAPLDDEPDDDDFDGGLSEAAARPGTVRRSPRKMPGDTSASHDLADSLDATGAQRRP